MDHAPMGSDAPPRTDAPQSSQITELANRRRSRRLRLNIPAQLVQQTGNPAPVDARILELSVSGVGLLTEAEPVSGAIYQLSAFDSLVPVGLHVKIISVRPRPDQRFDIGAEVI